MQNQAKCLLNVQILELRKFDKENWKKVQNHVKMLYFFQPYMKFAVGMATSKMMHTQLTYENFRRG